MTMLGPSCVCLGGEVAKKRRFVRRLWGRSRSELGEHRTKVGPSRASNIGHGSCQARADRRRNKSGMWVAHWQSVAKHMSGASYDRNDFEMLLFDDDRAVDRGPILNRVGAPPAIVIMFVIFTVPVVHGAADVPLMRPATPRPCATHLCQRPICTCLTGAKP